MKKYLILFLVVFLSTPAIAATIADNIDFGGQVRFRGYNLQNMWDLNDDVDTDNWDTYRLYTSIDFKATPSENVTGFVKLTNQTYGNGISDAGDNTSNKVFVDNAYITVSDFFKTGTTLYAGRMDLMYGSGFVIFDGNSQFASTNIYFDGIKLSIPLGENAHVDALYFKDEENNRSEAAGDDITLSGAYLIANCPKMGGQQELYALNRNDEIINKDIWMTGIRLSNTYKNGLDYSGEFAYQFGQFNDSTDIDKDAMGYKLDLGFTFLETALEPRIFCGYVFLEGDDPDTKDNERWDVFYGGWPQYGGKIGGWPQFGDLLAWKYVNMPTNAIKDYDTNWNEGSSTPGEAVFNNLTIASVGISAKLCENLKTNLCYGMLTADETNPGADDDIGDYYQVDFNYTYSKGLSFGLYAALIEPGDAHIGEDQAYEVFLETKLKF